MSHVSISSYSIQRQRMLKHLQLWYDLRCYHPWHKLDHTWKITSYNAMELDRWWQNEACRRAKNPTGENALHYNVVKHRKRHVSVCYSFIRFGRESDHSLYKIWKLEYRIRSRNSRCCTNNKVGDYTYVLAIELKNIEKSNTPSEKQDN